ncbi:caspase family protein [Streptomyces sp. SID8379]|uniref:effector-associated domain 2-containing protein n=1 Tax=unclassified Streptomyces TaxID=2593676 RepID=UPI000378EF95|nr:caspase family protein [Streptomyces sp. HmicA12]MYW64025.1 caspase family protein [Streptomyces sp. SID8379]
MTDKATPARGVDPARVHALVVGIEQYEAGSSWDLPGPARDAVAFHALLRDAGVPQSQLHLHLSPLAPYTPDVAYAPADHATLRHALVRHLPEHQGDVLWVWWGGHGVLDRAGHTRLFCADATTADKVAVDLDSALIRYAGDAVPGFADQLWIVDACETFEERLGFRGPLPPDALPAGERTLGHRQTVLRAAGAGRAAANDPVRATGLFSDVLLGLLRERAAVLPALPDPEELFPAVRRSFAVLRAEGRTAQRPEIRMRSPERTEILPRLEPPRSPGSGVAVLGRAVNALLDYPLMTDPAERQALVEALGPRLGSTMPRHTKPRTDATGMLTTLARRGPEALGELLSAVTALDDDPERQAELAAALGELGGAGQARDGRR